MRVHDRKEFLKLSGLGALTAHLFGKEVDATPAAEVEGVEPVVVDDVSSSLDGWLWHESRLEARALAEKILSDFDHPCG